MKSFTARLLLGPVAMLLIPLLGAVAAENGAKLSPEDVHHVLIVAVGTYNKSGVAHTSAVSLLDTGDKPSKENIARMLAMFPNCLSKPAGTEPPIGFETEHEVIIFVGDQHVKLSVGSNGKLWSAGTSQFKMVGNFREFLGGIGK